MASRFVGAVMMMGTFTGCKIHPSIGKDQGAMEDTLEEDINEPRASINI